MIITLDGNQGARTMLGRYNGPHLPHLAASICTLVPQQKSETQSKSLKQSWSLRERVRRSRGGVSVGASFVNSASKLLTSSFPVKAGTNGGGTFRCKSASQSIFYREKESHIVTKIATLALLYGAPKGTWLWRKIRDGRKNYILMHLCSLKTFPFPEKHCILLQSICDLS